MCFGFLGWRRDRRVCQATASRITPEQIRTMRRSKRRYLRRHFQWIARQRREHKTIVKPLHRRYRVPLLVALLLGYALIYCCTGLPFPHGSLMQSEFDSIHNGMSLEEVEGILGKPSRVEPDGTKTWGEREGVIIIEFDGLRVRGKDFVPFPQPSRWPRRW